MICSSFDACCSFTPHIKQFVQSLISCCQSAYSCLRGYTKDEFTITNCMLVQVQAEKTKYLF